MRVLVTGSSGWLGRHLAPMLERAGHAVLGLDPAPGAHTHLVASVADREAVARVFRDHRFEAVIHAGALHKPDIARYPQQAFIDVNVTGTLNLLEEAAARPGTRFVFTSTTSLMISRTIREERGGEAVWLDEDAGPLEPRNIYGVTKLAAEGLCRQHHGEGGPSVIILRTARFFPEQDDTLTGLSGPNLKANELLNRRASVRDMARAHLAALERADTVGFGLYIVSAPTPFRPGDAARLKTDAASVIAQHHPEAEAIYATAGWRLPRSIGRVYDGSRITRDLGFAYETRFADVLDALSQGRPSPVEHDPSYVSPLTLC
jgi:UDP-glucose 4-epimerase